MPLYSRSSGSSSSSTTSSRDNPFLAAHKIGQKVGASFDNLFEKAGLMDDDSTSTPSPSGASTSGSSASPESPRKPPPSSLINAPPKNAFLQNEFTQNIPDAKSLSSGSQSSDFSRSYGSSRTPSRTSTGSYHSAPPSPTIDSGSYYSTRSRSSGSSRTSNERSQPTPSNNIPPPPPGSPHPEDTSSNSGWSTSRASADRSIPTKPTQSSTIPSTSRSSPSVRSSSRSSVSGNANSQRSPSQSTYSNRSQTTGSNTASSRSSTSGSTGTFSRGSRSEKLLGQASSSASSGSSTGWSTGSESKSLTKNAMSSTSLSAVPIALAPVEETATSAANSSSPTNQSAFPSRSSLEDNKQRNLKKHSSAAEEDESWKPPGLNDLKNVNDTTTSKLSPLQLTPALGKKESVGDLSDLGQLQKSDNFRLLGFPNDTSHSSSSAVDEAEPTTSVSNETTTKAKDISPNVEKPDSSLKEKEIGPVTPSTAPSSNQVEIKTPSSPNLPPTSQQQTTVKEIHAGAISKSSPSPSGVLDETKAVAKENDVVSSPSTQKIGIAPATPSNDPRPIKAETEMSSSPKTRANSQLNISANRHSVSDESPITKANQAALADTSSVSKSSQGSVVKPNGIAWTPPAFDADKSNSVKQGSPASASSKRNTERTGSPASASSKYSKASKSAEKKSPLEGKDSAVRNITEKLDNTDILMNEKDPNPKSMSSGSQIKSIAMDGEVKSVRENLKTINKLGWGGPERGTETVEEGSEERWIPPAPPALTNFGNDDLGPRKTMMYKPETARDPEEQTRKSIQQMLSRSQPQSQPVTKTPIRSHTTRKSPEKSSPLIRRNDTSARNHNTSSQTKNKANEAPPPPVEEIEIGPPADDESSLGSMGWLFPALKKKEEVSGKVTSQKVSTTPQRIEEGREESSAVCSNKNVNQSLGRQENPNPVPVVPPVNSKPEIRTTNGDYYKSWIVPGEDVAEADKKDPPGPNISSKPPLSSIINSTRPPLPIAIDSTKLSEKPIQESSTWVAPSRGYVQGEERAWDSWVPTSACVKTPDSSRPIPARHDSFGSAWAPPDIQSRAIESTSQVTGAPKVRKAAGKPVSKSDETKRRSAATSPGSDSDGTKSSFGSWFPASAPKRIDHTGHVFSQGRQGADRGMDKEAGKTWVSSQMEYSSSSSSSPGTSGTSSRSSGISSQSSGTSSRSSGTESRSSQPGMVSSSDYATRPSQPGSQTDSSPARASSSNYAPRFVSGPQSGSSSGLGSGSGTSGSRSKPGSFGSKSSSIGSSESSSSGSGSSSSNRHPPEGAGYGQQPVATAGPSTMTNIDIGAAPKGSSEMAEELVDMEDSRSEEKKSCLGLTPLKLFLFVSVVLLINCAALAIIFLVVLEDDPDAQNVMGEAPIVTIPPTASGSDGAPTSTISPIASPIDTDPTPPPGASPTSPPTTSPPAGSPDSNDPLYQLVVNAFPSGESALQDTSSPQYKALQWLGAPANNDISTDEGRLLQRYALATLFYATTGDSWTSNDLWLSGDDECTWFSSTTKSSGPCDTGGNYIELNLRENNLNGPVPPEIAILVDLTVLKLPVNKLSGAIPTTITRLPLLEELDLSSNDLFGIIPSELGLMTSLERLVFFYNNLFSTIPSSLGQLTRLELLDLGSNQLEGQLPSTLGNMESLAGFSVFNNFISGSLPASMSNLENLQLLYIDNTDIVGPVDFMCAISAIDEFWSDCEETGCTCCDVCCNDNFGCV